MEDCLLGGQTRVSWRGRSKEREIAVDMKGKTNAYPSDGGIEDFFSSI